MSSKKKKKRKRKKIKTEKNEKCSSSGSFLTFIAILQSAKLAPFARIFHQFVAQFGSVFRKRSFGRRQTKGGKTNTNGARNASSLSLLCLFQLVFFILVEEKRAIHNCLQRATELWRSLGALLAQFWLNFGFSLAASKRGAKRMAQRRSLLSCPNGAKGCPFLKARDFFFFFFF